jgi:threonine aldolase
VSGPALEPPGAVNLISDTQTRPSAEMREAIASAVVGDEQKGWDPTVIELEERVAGLLGHEAGLFLPSGTMCNQIAIRLHCGRAGDEIILDRLAHPIVAEAGGPAVHAGAMTNPIDAPGGIFGAIELERALRPAGDRYTPRSRLVSVEQSTNLRGGRVWPLETIDAVIKSAHMHGLATHMDGARLLNASVASGVTARAFAAGFDTAWLDFSKGLGAPVGAVLVGSRELMDEAWRFKQMMGGALRQAGVLAAACLYALDHNLDRLAEDHAHARVLAEALEALPGATIDASTVETNIVIFECSDAAWVVSELEKHGVLVGALSPHVVRAVTHLDVDRDEIDRAVQAFGAVLGSL